MHLAQHVPPPLEATVTGYFFSVFARSGTFAYLPEYASLLSKDVGVMQALCASSLGSMALQYNNDKLSQTARHYYAASLLRVNQDLSQPATAVLDSSLIRVLLLSAFEALCFHDGGDYHNWATHIRGSSNLLLMRGKAQLKSPFGRLLFHHAGVNILINSVNHKVPVSVELLELFEYATSSSLLPETVSIQIMQLLSQAAVAAPMISNMPAEEAFMVLLQLDARATVFQNELEETVPFETLQIANSVDGRRQSFGIDTFEGVMHRYADQQVARLYNTARTTRLNVRQWMFKRLCDSSTQEHMQGWTRKRVLVEGAGLVSDMLASVPYSLDLLDSATSTEARYLMWPLTNMATLDVCPAPAKRYIIDSLRALAEKFHLRRAKQAADILDRREGEPIR
ncbi:hypothetical protein FHETE_980 [Fusarium heterosporum]|uniref:Uncharacterized protein n=1 Tax=Fusarium heterosporum TaxID=42747 RepID=A0A8H5TVQ6_FUSHE|nr:hypothetical protein FHETE_980 [Fusarium heterosporum]